MYCKNCGQVLNENQAVCLSCGVKVGKGNRYCANCGNAVSENAVYCLNCGADLKKQTDNGFGEYSKVLIAVLCFFFGGFGVHNFMLGETKKGILKIILTCCCGIGCIFALIDFIKILTDTYEVDSEKYI